MPAPNAYDPLDSGAAKAPAFTLASRTGEDKPNGNPAPNAYEKEKYNVTGDAPAASLASRVNTEKPNTNPAPCEYDPDISATRMAAPQFSLRARVGPS